MSNRLEALSYTARRMVAASLEIDGRVARAAEAVVGGHVSEFTYAGHLDRPISAKAVELEELKAELEALVARVGVEALIEDLRAPRRTVTPITEVHKDLSGLTAYSVRINCPACDTTGRDGAQGCGRCAGAGHMWTKPAKPTEAEKAAADALLEAEAVIAAGHRADALAIRRTAAERRAIMAAEAEAREPRAAAEEAARTAEDKQAEELGDLFAEVAAENDVAAARKAATVATGRFATLATDDAEIEAQVAAFSALLNAAPSKPLVFSPLTFDGRPGFAPIVCDDCFATDRVVNCRRCDRAGVVLVNQAAREAKAAAVEERRNAPVTDPADLEDEEPTPDRARVWDEAAAAYMNTPDRHRHTFPLVNPYAAPDAEPCGHEIAGRSLEDPAEYCETPADECDRHDS